MQNKKVFWLIEDGTFTDRFGAEQEATIVKQQVVAEHQETKTREGGYGQPVKRYIYKDELGRKFVKVNDGVAKFQGRTWTEKREDEDDRIWEEAKKLDRKKPYITPDGEQRVEIISEDHEPGYEFYENTQLIMMIE